MVLLAARSKMAAGRPSSLKLADTTTLVCDYIRQLAQTPPAFAAIRAEAQRKGTDKLTMAQIDREVAAVRGEAAKKKNKRSRR